MASQKLTIPAMDFTAPAGIVPYLIAADASLKVSSTKHIGDVLSLPAAAKNMTLKHVDESDVADEYKKLADCTASTKHDDIAACDHKARDALNKTILEIVRQAATTTDNFAGRLILGHMDAFEFTRFSTFRAFINLKYGGSTKISEHALERLEAKVVMHPSHADELLNVDYRLQVSNGAQMTDFFARIYSAQAEYKSKASSNGSAVIDTSAVWKLVESRLKTKMSVTGQYRRYTDEEWSKIAEKKASLPDLETILVTTDLNKITEDVITEVELDTGAAGINVMQRTALPDLPPGPGPVKSKTPCPFGSRCRFKPKNNCFYMHDGHPGRLQVKSPSDSKSPPPDSLAANARAGDVFVIGKDKRARRLDDVGGTAGGRNQRAKVKAKDIKKKRGGGKSSMGFSLLSSIIMSAIMMPTILFGSMADGLSLTQGFTEATPTFHSAFKVADSNAAVWSEIDWKTNAQGGNVTLGARDTGCSTKGGAVKDKRLFNSLVERDDINPIRAANGSLIPVKGIGTVKARVDAVDKRGRRTKVVIKIRGVYYVPGLTVNVFSDNSLVSDGFQFVKDSKHGSIVRTPDRQHSILLRQEHGLELWQGHVLTKRVEDKINAARTVLVSAINDHDHDQVKIDCKNIVNGTTQVPDDAVEEKVTSLTVGMQQASSKMERRPFRMALAKLGVYTVEDARTDKLLKVHAQLGHCSSRRMVEFLQGFMTQDEIKKEYGSIAEIWCSNCELAKIRRAPTTGGKMERATKFGEKTIYDVVGPFPTAKGTGYKYALALLDDSTNFLTIRGLKDLANVPAELDRHLSWIETIQGKDADSEKELIKYEGAVGILHPDATKRVHSDSASYFKSADAELVYAKHKATHTASAPYNQNQNKVERMIKTVTSMSNAMLIAADGLDGSGMDNSFWYFSLTRACDINNKLPCAANEGRSSPYSQITGRRPTLHNQIPFGCRAVAMKMAGSHKKQPVKGDLGIWLGYNSTNHSHIIFVPRKAGRDSFRQTRNFRVPRGLMGAKLTRGQVELDAEAVHVKFPTTTTTTAPPYRTLKQTN